MAHHTTHGVKPNHYPQSESHILLFLYMFQQAIVVRLAEILLEKHTRTGLVPITVGSKGNPIIFENSMMDH
jgi:hypothetical protein